MIITVWVRWSRGRHDLSLKPTECQAAVLVYKALSPQQDVDGTLPRRHALAGATALLEAQAPNFRPWASSLGASTSRGQSPLWPEPADLQPAREKT